MTVTNPTCDFAVFLLKNKNFTPTTGLKVNCSKDLPGRTFSSWRNKYRQPELESLTNRSSNIYISFCLFWYVVAQPPTVMGGVTCQDSMQLTGGRS